MEVYKNFFLVEFLVFQVAKENYWIYNIFGYIIISISKEIRPTLRHLN